MVCFKITALVADHFVREDWLTFVHAMESFTLVGLLGWLVYQLAVLLWTHRVRNGGHGLVLVA